MTTICEPQTAHIMWQQYIGDLDASPEQAEAAIAQIHSSFGELHMWYSENGDFETAQRIATAYEHAHLVYQQNGQYRLALAAGQAAISSVAEQRDDAITEMHNLLEAISEQSEAHPQLKSYAATIRDEERQAVLEDEDYLDDATDLALSSVRIRIFTTMRNIGTGGQWRAELMLDYIMGKRQMAAEQRDAFVHFVDTLS